MRFSSINELGQLMQSDDKNIARISPKGDALSNGLNYCCVEIKSIDGANYLVQEYGNEATVLYEKAMIIMSIAKARNKVDAKSYYNHEFTIINVSVQ